MFIFQKNLTVFLMPVHRKISSPMLKRIIGKIWEKMPPLLRMKIVRTSQQKFTVSVAAIIINENDEILLLDHVLRPAASWGIPGGFLNHDEQPSDGVRRELLEETGIELTNVEMFQVRTIRRHIEILFRAEAVGTPLVKSREINAVGWFRADNMPENMSRRQRTVIEKLLKGSL